MRIISATAALLLLSACNRQPEEPAVEVEEAMVMLPAVSGRPGAAYFTLRSNNDPTKIVSVSSPKVERIELHETREEKGVSRMAPIEDLNFPAGGVMEFKPGGRHAMLFGLDSSLKAGDRIPITFTFEPVPPVTAEAEIHAAGSHEGH
jgi:periplasmic copper chaperone A